MAKIRRRAHPKGSELVEVRMEVKHGRRGNARKHYKSTKEAGSRGKK